MERFGFSPFDVNAYGLHIPFGFNIYFGLSNMLRLVDLIKLSGITLGNFKIHCAIDNKRGEWRPLDEYHSGTFEIGQSYQTQENFNCDNVISLINLSHSRRWLYVGVYRVDGVTRSDESGLYHYDLHRLPGLDHLDGRALIDFNKYFRNSYLVGKNHENKLIVNSIRPERMSIADFPGFNDVLLSFPMLRSIIRQEHPSWRTALSNIAGVYVISDRETGHQYVGSAYGGIGIWQRWSEYARSGHGGNRELRELLHHKGETHAEHFQFSLVEVCDINASDDYIISRESHWKDALLSREFGYNRN